MRPRRRRPFRGSSPGSAKPSPSDPGRSPLTPELPPIFSLIQELGQISDAKMFQVFNMGMSFYVILPESEVAGATAILRDHGVGAFWLGYAVLDKERKIILRPKGLVGRENRFAPLKGEEGRRG